MVADGSVGSDSSVISFHTAGLRSSPLVDVVAVTPPLRMVSDGSVGSDSSVIGFPLAGLRSSPLWSL